MPFSLQCCSVRRRGVPGGVEGKETSSLGPLASSHTGQDRQRNSRSLSMHFCSIFVLYEVLRIPRLASHDRINRTNVSSLRR